MITVTTLETGCGIKLATTGRAVYALTPCCRRPADWAGRCECGRKVTEGYSYAAIPGSRFWLRDLRNIVEALACDSPAECVADIVARLEP